MNKIEIKTEYIKLDSLLKFAGIVSSGAEAKHYISENQILVNNEPENRRGRKIYKGDKINSPNGEIYVC